jgi:MFS transporter, PHS family, inorganic phosphate transporter
MVGSLIIIKAIKYWSSKAIQFYGFIALFILFLVLGGAFSKLLNSNYKGIIIALYVLCQLCFNLGPNTTTFIIPAEIYPTRYRCTCHGFSAAAGKLGSIIGQIFLAYVRFPGEGPDNQGPLGWILMCLAIFMAIGATVSRILLPETRDEKGKSRSLEVMAQGRVKLQALSKSLADEDRAD